jgi:precorrin-6A/cobalt-precorrin-6A reductase
MSWALLRNERISCLVTKNAGGNATAAKIAAARTLRLHVIMIARPAKPECQTVTTVDEAMLGIMRWPG